MFGAVIPASSRMLVFLVLLSRLHWSWPRTLQDPSEGLTSSTPFSSSALPTLQHTENNTLYANTETEVTNATMTAILEATHSLGSQGFRNEERKVADVPTSTVASFDTSSSCPEDNDVIKTGSVFLTVGSLAETSGSGSITERRLQLNWHGFSGDPGQDTVALFDRDPNVPGISVPLDQARVVDHPNGYFTTYVQFPRVHFTASNLSSDCLGFWAAYLRGGVKVLAVSCFRARPFWMQDLQKQIGELSLKDLMIPGTHDSGSYMPYMGKKSENVLIRYIYAQEENAFNQLAYGIRCLDLRVGFYNKTKEKFWINHSYFKTVNPLSTVIEDIVSFMNSTSEIVILDFHRFPVGFDRNPTAHKMLIDYLVSKLGPYLIPYETANDYRVKIKHLLGSKKRLLVAYNSKQRNRNQLLWPGIRQLWGDKQHADELMTYFDSTFQGELPHVLWSAMAELTPTSSDIFRQPRRGLRMLADEVNWKLTSWFRDFWADSTNVVATDYFLGNNLIQVSIDVNSRKKCSNRRNGTAF